MPSVLPRCSSEWLEPVKLKKWAAAERWLGVPSNMNAQPGDEMEVMSKMYLSVEATWNLRSFQNVKQSITTSGGRPGAQQGLDDQYETEQDPRLEYQDHISPIALSNWGL